MSKKKEKRETVKVFEVWNSRTHHGIPEVRENVSENHHFEANQKDHEPWGEQRTFIILNSEINQNII